MPQQLSVRNTTRGSVLPISHYEIIEKIGEGGMGAVYKARDIRLDRSVALKILPGESVTNAERKRRFALEAKAASALNHPNIVTIYDIDEADGVDFIAMEYVTGQTLADMIPPDGMDPAQAIQFGAQIADALATAHQSGIVHRDLKPSNIMVNAQGRVKLLDFGLAKLIEPVLGGVDTTRTAQTRDGMILGTGSYMAPEQAEGRPVDQRADIFSFGTVLYELLSGGNRSGATRTCGRSPPSWAISLRRSMPRVFRPLFARSSNAHSRRTRTPAINPARNWRPLWPRWPVRWRLGTHRIGGGWPRLRNP